MKYQHSFILLVSLLGLFACSSQSTQKPKLSETFFTEIKSSGAKHFTYTVVDLTGKRESVAAYRQKEVDRGTKSLDETRRKRNLKTVQDKKRKEITPLMEAKIVESGFCQGGYRIINSYFRHNRSEIRGECNDTATNEDKMKFHTNRAKKYDFGTTNTETKSETETKEKNNTDTTTVTAPGVINSDNMILNLP